MGWCFNIISVNSNLLPPTTVKSTAPAQYSHGTKKQEWLASDPKMCKKLHDWVQKGGLELSAGETAKKDPLKMVEAKLEHLQCYTELSRWLETENSSLAAIFAKELGSGALDSNNQYHPKHRYLCLFELVSGSKHANM